MSLIKSIKAQLGLSVTAANNFTLDASADDGTMKLVKGASTNVMTIASDGQVAFPQNPVEPEQRLGVGQTWQTVTRTSGQDYTNNTGRPIMAYVRMQQSGTLTPIIGGLTFGTLITVTGQGGVISVIIPTGAIYRFTGTVAFTVQELR